MTATLIVETTVRREYNDTETVHVKGQETKEVELTRELETVEECLKALNGTRNEVVRMCWDEVKDTEEFEEFGYYGPYAKGDITVSPSSYASQGPTIHDIVDEIAEREDVEDKAGIYVHLIEYSSRMDIGMKPFLQYLASERGVDTSYCTHGEK